MDAKKALASSKFTFPSNAGELTLQQRQIEQRLEDFIRIEKMSMATKSLDALRYDWEWFFTWCFEGRTIDYQNNCIRRALPAEPQTLIDFIEYWVGLRAPASIRRCLSSIAKIHRGAGLANPLDDPLVASMAKKIGRGLSDKEKKQKEILINHLNAELDEAKEQLDEQLDKRIARFAVEMKKALRKAENDHAAALLAIDPGDHDAIEQCDRTLKVKKADIKARFDLDIKSVRNAVYIKPLKQLPKPWKLHHNLAGDQRQAKGLQWHHIRRIQQVLMVEPLRTEIPNGRQGAADRQFNAKQIFNARNRAIAAVAYDTLCRASEIVSFTVEDIDYKSEGHAHLILRKGKTNQQGKKKRKFISKQTVAELEQWLDLVDLISGPIFCSLDKNAHVKRDPVTGALKPLTTRSLLNIYKTLACTIGEDAELFSCHSTRVGATQDMVAANIGMLAVKQAGDWKSDRMPSRYAEESEVDSGGMAQLAARQNRIK